MYCAKHIVYFKCIELLLHFYNWMEIISLIFVVKEERFFLASFSTGGRGNEFKIYGHELSKSFFY